MKGADRIPLLSDLAGPYEALQKKDHIPTTAELLLWAQWIRFDPRLGEIFTRWLSQHWQIIHPLAMNVEILKSPWPAVWGVLLDQVEALLRLEKRCIGSELQRWKAWKKLMLAEVQPDSPQLFYFQLVSPVGKIAQEWVNQPSRDFAAWGYFANDAWINKAPWAKRTAVKTEVRLRVLQRLAKSGEPFTTRAYIEALGGRVTWRQAQRDLQSFPRLHSEGATKDRTWKRR